MEFELIKHLKSNKYFVLLDDSRFDRWKVINPAGAKLAMPVEQFDEEPELMTLDEAAPHLTDAQLDAAKKEYANDESQAAQMVAAMERQKEQAAAPARATSPSTSRPRKKREKVDNRTGLGATWSSSGLTFYRHHIDPLGPKQSFRISTDSSGTIQMTKSEFQSVFNDVIMSPKYRQDGFFTYDQVPEKAKKFIKSEE